MLYNFDYNLIQPYTATLLKSGRATNRISARIWGVAKTKWPTVLRSDEEEIKVARYSNAHKNGVHQI